jgi:tyrosyl-tRNA synthetase
MESSGDEMQTRRERETTGDDLEARYALIARDLEEVIGDREAMIEVMAQRPLVVYWGTAPTGKPHLGYFVPLFKLADFLTAGCRVRVLFADVHALLDSAKTREPLLEARCRWYETAIRAMLEHIGVDIARLDFVRGSTYQTSAPYALALCRLCAQVTETQAQKAGAEVVKAEGAAAPPVSNLLYPLMQALDEEFLGADVQFGGRDQRKIFAFARDHAARILGHRKRFHLVNPLVPGLGSSGKMSASDPSSKVDLDDPDDAIRSKIYEAHVPADRSRPQDVGLLAIARHILWRWMDPRGLVFEVAASRDGADGKGEKQATGSQPISFASPDEVEEAFVEGRLTVANLKAMVADLLCLFVAPLRERLISHADAALAAYPPSHPPPFRPVRRPLRWETGGGWSRCDTAFPYMSDCGVSFWGGVIPS